MAETMSSRQMLSRLVAFPTVSSETNLPLIAFVEEYLAGHGIASTRVPDETGLKASLYAQIGPDVAGGVILSSHTDVVPTEGQDWSSDPFTVVERDGRLYGRGTCDMKGFAAIGLALVPEMLKARLKRPIQFALTYDEEVGCFGAPPLIEAMRANLPKAAATIVGEPSLMRVVTGHKGVVEINTHVRGFEVHSSILHTGVSAVMIAARLIDWHNARNTENSLMRPIDPRNAAFDPPWTTLHVGTITGGTAHNITARDCWFPTDVRTVPSDKTGEWVDRYRAFVAGVEAEMKAIQPSAAINISIGSTVEGCRPEENGIAEALARSLTGDNGTHVVSYGTEAGQFQDGGYSTVVCGPGSIEQAHQADEYLSVEQLNAGETFVRRLISHLSE